MLRNKLRFGWILLGLVLAAALWALNIELTFEHNVRRGIPADFIHHRAHRPLNWKV